MHNWHMPAHAMRRLGVALLLATAISSCSSDRSDDAVDTSAASSTTTEDTVAPSSSTSSTVAATSTTAPPSVPPSVPAGPVPGAVTITNAGAGGGSGERQLDWNVVAGATGYNVYRAPAAGGPFTLVASFNVNTMQITTVADVVNIFSDHQVWKPTSSSDGSASTVFTYVELSSTTDRYFRVRAYNANGQGPAGATVCAQRFGESAC